MKLKKTLNKKVLVSVKRLVEASLIIGIAIILLTATIIYAVTPSTTFYISSGVYPGAPSYTVWVEDSNYFAKNANGEIEYSDPDYKTLMDNVFTAIGTSGKSIFQQPGLYTLTSQLVITNKNFVWYGVEWKRYPGFGDYSGSTIIKGFDGDMIIINYTNLDDSGFVIKDLGFEGDFHNPPPGSGRTGKGIIIDKSMWFTLEHVHIGRMEDDALTLTNGGVFRLLHCNLGELYGRGIYMKDMGQDWWLYDVEANNGVSYTEPHRIALFIDTGCDGGHITGGHFEGYHGIAVDSKNINIYDTFFPWAYNSSVVMGYTRKVAGILDGCHISGGNQGNVTTNGGHPSSVYWNASYGKILNCAIAGKYQAYLIYEEDGCAYNDFSHNSLYAANQTSRLVKYVRKISPYTDVTFNGWRYHTEHEGTNTITAGQTSISFLHFLHYETGVATTGITPNIVLVTFNDELGIDNSFWYNVNNTRITVYISAVMGSNMDFCWDARFTTTTP